MPTFATNIQSMGDSSSTLSQIGQQIAAIAEEVKSGIVSSTQEFEGQTADHFHLIHGRYQQAHARLTDNTHTASQSAGNIGHAYEENEVRGTSLWQA